MEPITLDSFDKLTKRDFENEAIIFEIRQSLKQRESLLKIIKALYIVTTPWFERKGISKELMDDIESLFIR